jgi:phosphate/phosphite/phosphonate ABC transporter binding protein
MLISSYHHKVKWGTQENPLIMALAPLATTQELLASGDAIAQQLSALTGYTIKTTVPTSYGALVEAMGSGNAHIGWLPPFAYVVAHAKGYADVGLITIRFGSDHYGMQFLANAGSGFTSYYDEAKNKDTADAKTALSQFEGKKPCWTDPLSSSGYIIPTGILKAAGVTFKNAAFVQGHPTVVRALYATGICDFGATFIDARTQSGHPHSPYGEFAGTICPRPPQRTTLAPRSPFGTTVYYLTRSFFNITRSYEPLVMATIFAFWVGYGPFAGTLAMTVVTVASLGKLFSEAVESIDPGPIEALQSSGANRLQTVIYAFVPQIIPDFVSFIIYHWDINVRISTIIGFVGGGGIGYYLSQQINSLINWHKAGTAIWAIVIVVWAMDFLSSEVRKRLT